MCLISSPAVYSLCSANSTEEPWCGERCSPARAPSTTVRARSSRFDSFESETGSKSSTARTPTIERPLVERCRSFDSRFRSLLGPDDLEEPVDQLRGFDAFGLGVEVGDEAVLQRRARQRAHVLDGGGGAPLEDRLGLGA